MSSEPRGWKELLRADPTDWLLEPNNPSVRYFTLRDILERPEDDPEVMAARGAIMTSEPVTQILAAQYPAGYWVKPGRGYSPKYKATVWQLMFLADLGASRTGQIDRACQYALEHAYRADLGLFSAHKYATGTIACLNGNLLRAYFHFDYGSHPVVRQVAEALAELVVRDEFRCRYNSTATNKPATWLPCAWGAIKALRGFAQIPEEERSPAVGQAIQLGVNFLLSHDLTLADYPNAHGVSPLWFRFGFPLAYNSDILEALEVLTRLGFSGDKRSRSLISLPTCTPDPDKRSPTLQLRASNQDEPGERLSPRDRLSDDPRLTKATDFILSKQDDRGRWSLEYTPGNMWATIERKGQPSKWVTLRAIRLLKKVHS